MANGEMKEDGLYPGWRIFIILILAVGPSLQAADLAAAEAGRGEERAILAEINLARTNPLMYSNLLKDFRDSFDGKYYRVPGESRIVETREGLAAVDEAIDYLARQKPLPPLRWSIKLAAAAAELVDEQGRSGAVGHGSRQSGGVMERSKGHGSSGKMFGENISYGVNTPRNMVMQLIIDDGVASRNHRKNQFRPGFTEVGIACGSHPEYEMMCVIDFSDG
jgi:uncharacterized protein YkwD